MLQDVDKRGVRVFVVCRTNALAGPRGMQRAPGIAGLATRGILFSNSVPSSENIEKRTSCGLFIGCPAPEPILRRAARVRRPCYQSETVLSARGTTRARAANATTPYRWFTTSRAMTRLLFLGEPRSHNGQRYASKVSDRSPRREWSIIPVQATAVPPPHPHLDLPRSVCCLSSI